jgi:hypothetical protein
MISAGFIQKKTLSMPASCRVYKRKTDEISRTLRLMHDGINFDKILQKLTENNLRKYGIRSQRSQHHVAVLVQRVPH